MSDLDYSFFYHSAPQEEARQPKIQVKIGGLMPKKLDYNDEKEKKGHYKKKNIQKAKKQQQFQKGCKDLVNSFLKKSTKMIFSPYPYLDHLSQTTPLSDQYESTADNSIDETIRDSISRSNLNSPDINFISFNNVSLINRSIATQNISLNSGLLNNQQ